MTGARYCMSCCAVLCLDWLCGCLTLLFVVVPEPDWRGSAGCVGWPAAASLLRHCAVLCRHTATAGLPLHRPVTALPGLALTLTFAAAPPAPARPASPPRPRNTPHTLHTIMMETKHCVKPFGSAVGNLYLCRNHQPTHLILPRIPIRFN